MSDSRGVLKSEELMHSTKLFCLKYIEKSKQKDLWGREKLVVPYYERRCTFQIQNEYTYKSIPVFHCVLHENIAFEKNLKRRRPLTFFGTSREFIMNVL